MSYTDTDELRDLRQSIMACRTLDDLRSVQITVQRIKEDPADAFAAWCNEGPRLAKAAGLYVRIKVRALHTEGE